MGWPAEARRSTSQAASEGVLINPCTRTEFDFGMFAISSARLEPPAKLVKIMEKISATEEDARRADRHSRTHGRTRLQIAGL